MKTCGRNIKTRDTLRLAQCATTAQNHIGALRTNPTGTWKYRIERGRQFFIFYILPIPHRHSLSTPFQYVFFLFCLCRLYKRPLYSCQLLCTYAVLLVARINLKFQFRSMIVKPETPLNRMRYEKMCVRLLLRMPRLAISHILIGAAASQCK